MAAATYSRVVGSRVVVKSGEHNPCHKPSGPGGGQYCSTGGGGGSSIESDLTEVIDVEDADKVYGKEFDAAASWKQSLNPKEQAALVNYRDRGGFRKTNDYLRGGSYDERSRETAIRLESALSRSTVPNGTTLWRGMEIQGEVEGRQMRDALKVGAKINESAFMSASPSSAVAGGFSVDLHGGQPVLFQLTTKNAKGAYIAAKRNDLPEYLLRNGATVTVTKVKHFDSGLIHVEATVGH